MVKFLFRVMKFNVSIILAIVMFLGPLARTQLVHAAARYDAGISTSATLLRMSDEDLDKRMTDIERLGADWIRVDFSWPAIQPDNADEYHWSMYDRVVRVAGVHSLKILAILDYTPTWAQEPRCAKLVITWAAGQKCNPADNATFARFTRAVALRYKDQAIRAWEIWNEPNLSSYWKTAQPNSSAVHADVGAYSVFANEIAYQLRQNSPGTVIVTGGLSPLFTPVYPKGYRQSDYLRALLPLLDPDLFDAVGVHPYSWPVLPTTTAVYNAFYTVDNGTSDFDLRAIMSSAGWASKQQWGTEFGAPTRGLSAGTTIIDGERPDHVTEAVQAQIITQGIREWYDIPNAGPLFVHSDSDQWLPQVKNAGSFGLRRTDGTEKPSYQAYQTAVLGL